MNMSANHELLQTSLQPPQDATGWISGLKRRQRTPEVMDQPYLAESDHVQALRGLARTNCWGTTRRHVWKTICRIARERNLKSLRILDVASGAGDLAIWLKQQSKRNGLNLLIEGCDKSSTANEFATSQALRAGLNSLRFFQCDVLEGPLSRSYDIVTCSLFLHHLNEDEAAALLAKLASVARHAILVDDLRRSVRGYGLARLGCAALTRSPVVHVDAPLSVKAAFSENEAKELLIRAGLHGAVIRRHWPQRYLITWEQPWTANKVSNA